MCVVSTSFSCSPPCLPSLAAPRSLLSRQSVTRSPECWSNPSPGHVTTQLQPGHSPQLQPGQRIPSRAELSRAHIVLLQIFVSRAATILTRTRTQGWVRSRWNKILSFSCSKVIRTQPLILYLSSLPFCRRNNMPIDRYRINNIFKRQSEFFLFIYRYISYSRVSVPHL